MTLSEEKLDIGRADEEVLLSVRNLKTYFPILGGIFKRKIGVVKAVDGVSFDIHRNETVGLVGESGCGKTTIGNTILNLIEHESGDIYFQNQRLTQPKGILSKFQKKDKIETENDVQFNAKIRKKIQMVF